MTSLLSGDSVDFSAPRRTCALCIARSQPGYLPPESPALTKLGVPRAMHVETRTCECTYDIICADAVTLACNALGRGPSDGDESFIELGRCYQRLINEGVFPSHVDDDLGRDPSVRQLSRLPRDVFLPDDELLAWRVCRPAQYELTLHVTPAPGPEDSICAREFVNEVMKGHVKNRLDNYGYDPFGLGNLWGQLRIGRKPSLALVGVTECCEGGSRTVTRTHELGVRTHGNTYFHGPLGEGKAHHAMIERTQHNAGKCNTAITTPGSTIMPLHVDEDGCFVNVMYSGSLQLLVEEGMSLEFGDYQISPQGSVPFVLTVPNGHFYARAAAGQKFMWVRPMTIDQQKVFRGYAGIEYGTTSRRFADNFYDTRFFVLQGKHNLDLERKGEYVVWNDTVYADDYDSDDPEQIALAEGGASLGGFDSGGRNKDAALQYVAGAASALFKNVPASCFPATFFGAHLENRGDGGMLFGSIVVAKGGAVILAPGCEGKLTAKVVAVHTGVDAYGLDDGGSDLSISDE